MSVQYTGRYAVQQGMLSTPGDIMSTVGDMISTVGRSHEYSGGWVQLEISWVQWGISWVQWGISWVHWRVFSTLGDIMSRLGDITKNVGGHWENNWICMEPQCTEQPSVYSWYPPTVVMVSPSVLNTPCCTHDILSVYWTPPGVLHRHCAGW